MTLSDFKTRVQGKIHGTTIDQVNDFYGLVYEAAGNLLLRIDPFETKRITQITNAIYDQVYDYVLPTDVKGNKIIDIRPQVSRSLGDKVNQTYSQNFDLNKDNNDFTIEDNYGVRSLRLSKSLLSGSLINDCNALTSNGSWSSSGTSSSVATDTFNYVSGSGSIKFNLDVAGSSGGIVNSTETSVDLSSYKNVGSIFVFVYIPNITAITAITLRWGSSSSNYYSVTATSTQNNTAFIVGWNLVRFDWSGASTTGTPVDTAINYTAVLFTYNGTAVTACRVDNIIAKLGSIYMIVYYSQYLFSTSAGVWISKPTVDTDSINLSIEGINLLLYEVLDLVSQELQGKDGRLDIEYSENKKEAAYKLYGATYKSEVKKPREAYYRPYNLRRK